MQMPCIKVALLDSLLNKYRIYEAHLLLINPKLIEMTPKFNYIGLITATQRELEHLSVLSYYAYQCEYIYE